MFHTTNLHFLSIVIYFILIFASVIISIMGSMMIMTYLTSRSIDIKEEIIINRNIGISIVLGSFIWTIGNMCYETIQPVMNAWYSTYAGGVNSKSILIFSSGLIAALFLALLTGTVIIFMSLKILMVINRETGEWEEIKQGNTAIAIIIAVTVVLVGQFFGSIISYLVIRIFGLHNGI